MSISSVMLKMMYTSLRVVTFLKWVDEDNSDERVKKNLIFFKMLRISSFEKYERYLNVLNKHNFHLRNQVFRLYIFRSHKTVLTFR